MKDGISDMHCMNNDYLMEELQAEITNSAL